jgi:hypothetical protein
MIGTLDTEWDFNWLHLFNPAIEYTPKFDHRSLRSDRRWQHQSPTERGNSTHHVDAPQRTSSSSA